MKILKNMKNKIKIALSCLVVAFAITSCVDEKPLEFQITKPLSIADVEFLNSYDALKTYVNRSATPNLKLGANAAIADITDKGLMYRLLTTDFDQVTVDGMTHSTIVGDNGIFDFGNLSALLTIAGDAGISVFGPPLVANTGQNATYLNSLIADSLIINMIWVEGGGGDSGEQLIDGNFASGDISTSFHATWGASTGSLTADGTGPGGKGRALMVSNPDVQTDAWKSQMIIEWTTPMLEGETWTFKMDYKTDAACDFGNQAQKGAGNYMFNNIVPSVSSTPTWQTLESTFTVPANAANCTAIAFDLGLTATNYYFANVSLYKHPTVTETEMLIDGGFESGDISTSFHATWGSSTGSLTPDGQGSGGTGHALMISNPEVQTDAWKSQMIIEWTTPMSEGETWKFSMDYKSDAACDFGNQAQKGPGNYMFNNIVPSVSSTPTWQTLATTITVPANGTGCTAIAFDLGLTATNYYFDNFSLVRVGEGSGGSNVPDTTRIPKTPEEKTRIISGELGNWIKQIMVITGDSINGTNSIKDWTVVNQPMDDNNPTQLKTAPASPGTTDFYWQDYLGKDYARMAVQLARQNGGNDLKLFVNDNNLVNAAKCQGLIDMIKYWENDKVTKIDGIGTQLSLTYSLDATTQKSNEDAVVAMFNMLKGTGKLIKISALDMNLQNATGSVINTANVKRDEQLAMAKYYNFVVRKYFEIIPAAQRYGIDVNPVESTTNAGLWDSDYSRKFTYSGVADGLAGSELNHE